MQKDEVEAESGWVEVDPTNDLTWPIPGRRVLAERRDGFRAYMKRNVRDEMWYLAYPKAQRVHMLAIKRFRYEKEEVL